MWYSPSKNLRICNALTPGHHHVDLTRKIWWDLALAAGQRSELRLAHVHESTETRASGLSRICENQALTRLDTDTTACKRDRWERLDVQVAALGARLNERCGKCKDCTWTKSRIESIWHGNSVRCRSDECLVTSLDSHDRAGSAKYSWVLAKWSSAEVSRNTDGLEDAGSPDHVLGGIKVKVVLAWLNWLGACLRNGSHQLSDMSCLSATNGL